MGWAFGLVQAFAVGRFGFGLGSPFNGESVRTNMFKSVAGGIIGLSAPRWLEHDPHHQFTRPTIFFLLAMIAVAIAVAGWLMTQPLKALCKRRFCTVLPSAPGCVARPGTSSRRLLG